MNTGAIKLELSNQAAVVESQSLHISTDSMDRPVEGLEGHLNRYGADISQCPMLRNIGESALAQIQAEVADITDAAEKFKGMSIDDLLADKQVSTEKQALETIDTRLELKASAADSILMQADDLIESVQLQTVEWQVAIEDELNKRVDSVENVEIANSEPTKNTTEHSDLLQPQNVRLADIVRDEQQATSGVAEAEVVLLEADQPIPVLHEVMTKTDAKVLSVDVTEHESSVVEELIPTTTSVAVYPDTTGGFEMPLPDSGFDESIRPSIVEAGQTLAESHEVLPVAETSEEITTIESLLESMWEPEIIQQLETDERYQQLVEEVTSEAQQLVRELREYQGVLLPEELEDRCVAIAQLLVERYELPEVEVEQLVYFVQRMLQADLQLALQTGLHQDLLNSLGTTEYRFYNTQLQANPIDPMTRIERVSRSVMRLVVKRQELLAA